METLVESNEKERKKKRKGFGVLDLAIGQCK